MEIIFATSNEGKRQEVADFFATANIQHRYVLKTLKDLPNDILKQYDPQETGDSFSENAFIKAKALQELTNSAVFAEDSGLEVDALNGAPGIFSSRYAKDDEARIERLLQELKEKKNRTARFVTALCFISAQGFPVYFYGRAEGNIAYEKRGTQGFGYDPVFLFHQNNKQENNIQKTFAEMTTEQKRLVSHRGNALKKFLTFLQSQPYTTADNEKGS